MRFEITEDQQSLDAAAIGRGLREFNELHAPPYEEKGLVISARDNSGTLCGGLKGHSQRDWLYVAQLWVHESARGQRLGTTLMEMAEQAARDRGCTGVWLDTFSFQARGFYEKLGYELFGQLDHCPKGHIKYFLRKKF